MSLNPNLLNFLGHGNDFLRDPPFLIDGNIFGIKSLKYDLAVSNASSDILFSDVLCRLYS